MSLASPAVTLASWSAWVSHSSVIFVPVFAAYCWNIGCMGSFQVVDQVRKRTSPPGRAWAGTCVWLAPGAQAARAPRRGTPAAAPVAPARRRRVSRAQAVGG